MLKSIKTDIIEFFLPFGMAVFCVCVFIYGIGTFCTYKSMDNFTEMTGIEGKCTLTWDCFVKPHDKWIPYSIWKQSEINKTYRVKVKEYPEKFQELTAGEYEYLKEIQKSGEKLTADEIKAMNEYEEN